VYLAEVAWQHPQPRRGKNVCSNLDVIFVKRILIRILLLFSWICLIPTKSRSFPKRFQAWKGKQESRKKHVEARRRFCSLFFIVSLRLCCSLAWSACGLEDRLVSPTSHWRVFQNRLETCHLSKN
jgi:hypothetical protein